MSYAGFKMPDSTAIGQAFNIRPWMEDFLAWKAEPMGD
jgi:hypothetical protein